jgi:RND family efflux transporter MFP subunit
MRLLSSLPLLLLLPALRAASPVTPAAVARWTTPGTALAAESRVFPARLAARDQVELRTRVSGHLETATFTEGGRVRRGDLLFTLDARPFEIAVRRAEAERARATARLGLLEAEAERARRLSDSGALAAEELDSRVRQAAEAREAERVAAAQLAAAELDLAYTRIAAPMDGRIGARLVDPGNFVAAGGAALAVLVTEDPLDVWFEVDEVSAARWREAGGVTGAVVRVVVPSEGEAVREAVLDYLEPRVDGGSGTRRFRARLPNPDGRLAPGLHARVSLDLERPAEQLAVPERALGSDLGRPFVWVLDGEGIARHRAVETGPRLPDGRRTIRTGLQAADRVLVSGLMAVRPNQPVAAEPEPTAP